MNNKTREVLVMRANGLLVKQIAEQLNIHRRTVDWHIKSACMELKAFNSCHAIAIAMRDGLILVGEVGCIVLLCWSGLVGNIDARRGPSPAASARTSRREVII